VGGADLGVDVGGGWWVALGWVSVRHLLWTLALSGWRGVAPRCQHVRRLPPKNLCINISIHVMLRAYYTQQKKRLI